MNRPIELKDNSNVQYWTWVPNHNIDTRRKPTSGFLLSGSQMYSLSSQSSGWNQKSVTYEWQGQENNIPDTNLLQNYTLQNRATIIKKISPWSVKESNFVDIHIPD